MSSEPTVTIRSGGRVANISLPGGSLSTAAAAGLADAAEGLREDRSLRVLVVSARADDFCSGTDDGFDPYGFRPDPASALAAVRVPVVVAVRGACRAEGLELALACDIRVGAEGSSYGLTHLAEGRLPAWGGTQRLSRAVTPGRATMMTLTADMMPAPDAAAAGLLHTTAEDPEGEADRLADILAQRGPLSLELAKEAVHRGSELPLRDGLRLEGDLNHQLAASEDRAEGLAAFFEKRPPDFSGR